MSDDTLKRVLTDAGLHAFNNIVLQQGRTGRADVNVAFLIKEIRMLTARIAELEGEWVKIDHGDYCEWPTVGAKVQFVFEGDVVCGSYESRDNGLWFVCGKILHPKNRVTHWRPHSPPTPPKEAEDGK